MDTWWHAASLGEVGALEPVLERARERGSAGSFLVTTSTVAGRGAASELWGDRVRLAPLDFPGMVRRAFRAHRPRALLLVETELWPNWLAEALASGVRVGIVNGRISERSWRRYRRWRGLFRPLLSRVGAVAARTDEDAERFFALGAGPEVVRVTGNTKNDRLRPATPAVLPWREARVWTAGSVRPGEEAFLLPVFERLQERFGDLRLVLALRHPGAWPRLEEDLARRGLRWARRSRPDPEDAAAQVLIADTHGELAGLYASSTIAFVGGTLVPVGGHNPVEAALAGVPVLFGPHTGNVAEEVEALLAKQGGRRVTNVVDLEETVAAWLADPEKVREAGARAARAAEELRGASERTLAWLQERGVLEGEHPNA